MTSFPMTASMHTLDKLPLRQPIEHHILHQGKRKHQLKREKKAKTPMVSVEYAEVQDLLTRIMMSICVFLGLRTPLARSYQRQIKPAEKQPLVDKLKVVEQKFYQSDPNMEACCQCLWCRTWVSTITRKREKNSDCWGYSCRFSKESTWPRLDSCPLAKIDNNFQFSGSLMNVKYLLRTMKGYLIDRKFPSVFERTDRT